VKALPAPTSEKIERNFHQILFGSKKSMLESHLCADDSNRRKVMLPDDKMLFKN